MAWGDNYNTIFTKEFKVDDGPKVWKMNVEEHKTKGTLSMNIRQFKHTESYDGPTKKGLLIQIESAEDIDKYQKAFNDYFDKVKELL